LCLRYSSPGRSAFAAPSPLGPPGPGLRRGARAPPPAPPPPPPPPPHLLGAQPRYQARREHGWRDARL
ncbi:hypothetical protein, partial [Nocardia cyriacigeorgica]|uniref:hypothetical protein n=1 Tax=Nocardia cyriacigeorgica TaxID=135487 RepID=UPI0024550408